MLQRVWLRQSSSVGAGGHVSIWVVLRRGEGSASLMEHVQVWMDGGGQRLQYFVTMSV